MLRFRLTVLNFLELFIWGAWLTSLGGYMGGVLRAEGSQIGATFGTMGIAAIFMPAIIGMVADRWVNAERMLGICQLLVGATLLWASRAQSPAEMYWAILCNSLFYLPTLALNNTVCYTILKRGHLDPEVAYPPIRVWGTVGFVIAMWFVDLAGWKFSSNQLVLGAGAAIFMGIYSFTLPPCPPLETEYRKGITGILGLDAFVLFKDTKMAVFFIFSMLLGVALQITNTFGGQFLDDFKNIPAYSHSFAVEHSGILLSVSQISETLFILAIPFFLKRFGIKKVMLMSMFAWVFRFGFFAIGNPGSGFIFLALSMIVYGMAFDFFNISGSLFVEKESPPQIRASAQGLFMLMTNGLGAFIGGEASGQVVQHFTTRDQIRQWPKIWLTFAVYALIIGLLFPLFFHYKEKTAQNTPASKQPE